jgi:hypothetical protein
VNSPQPWVPHPCVLRKGGYHNRINLEQLKSNSETGFSSSRKIEEWSKVKSKPHALSSIVPAVAKVARTGHPFYGFCRRNQNPGPPARFRSFRKMHERWATRPTLRRVKCFYLTSPFIEPRLPPSWQLQFSISTCTKDASGLGVPTAHNAVGPFFFSYEQF